MRLEPTTMLAPGRTVAALVTQDSASASPTLVAIAWHERGGATSLTGGPADCSNRYPPWPP